MDNNAIPAAVLPDIEMYGGDTQPWEIYMTHENGVPYTVGEMTGYEARLTVTPFSVSNYSATVRPVLNKSGRLSSKADGSAVIMFEFNSSDTIYMRGKYIYQIAFSYGDTKLRVGQGKLIVRPNNNTPS